MKDFQKNLVAAWTDYVAGKIDAQTLKGASAGFGIYQQRDGKTMMRIRRVGGHLTSTDISHLIDLLRRFNGDYVHLTTRQDIQLHGIPAENVVAALEECERVGFAFRGGGGDTFRNTLISSWSGMHADSVFDVFPYAQELSDAFYAFDVAYGLPRKLKIGFADRPADAAIAQTNDLGFIAKIVDGNPVFETWVGGGIGSRPRLGIKLFDALPAKNCIRIALALTQLFNDKGCRTNRAHARIRFLREDLGDDAFVALLKEYYAKLPDDTPLAVPTPRAVSVATTFPTEVTPTAGFDTWKALAVTPLTEGRAGVRILVPFGNFTADQLEAFSNAMTPYGATHFEILPSQDLGLVIAGDQLPALYNTLAACAQDFICKSFVGNIRTCIGCTVCKSGVTDAPSIGRLVADYFDAQIRPLDTPEKIATARALLNDVRISGCPNACTNHPLAKFGFAGRKLNGADAETVFTPGNTHPPTLGTADTNHTPIPVSDLSTFLESRLRTY